MECEFEIQVLQYILTRLNILLKAYPTTLEVRISYIILLLILDIGIYLFNLSTWAVNNLACVSPY